VRLALLAVGHNRPDGQTQPVEALRERVATAVDAYSRCDRNGVVGAALPGLIRDLHTSIAAGRNVAELLDLAVLLHSHATVGWLRVVGGTLDLRSQAAELARRERETPQALGLAAWGGMYVLVMAGAVDLAHAELDAVTVPTTTPESTQRAGMLALCQAFLAMAESRAGDVAALLELATELAAAPGRSTPTGWGSARRRSATGERARRWRSLITSRQPGSPRAWQSRLTRCAHGRPTIGSPTATARYGVPGWFAGVARPGVRFW
jgi:hypothetical protein